MAEFDEIDMDAVEDMQGEPSLGDMEKNPYDFDSSDDESEEMVDLDISEEVGAKNPFVDPPAEEVEVAQPDGGTDTNPDAEIEHAPEIPEEVPATVDNGDRDPTSTAEPTQLEPEQAADEVSKEETSKEAVSEQEVVSAKAPTVVIEQEENTVPPEAEVAETQTSDGTEANEGEETQASTKHEENVPEKPVAQPSTSPGVFRSLFGFFSSKKPEEKLEDEKRRHKEMLMRELNINEEEANSVLSTGYKVRPSSMPKVAIKESSAIKVSVSVEEGDAVTTTETTIDPGKGTQIITTTSSSSGDHGSAAAASEPVAIPERVAEPGPVDEATASPAEESELPVSESSSSPVEASVTSAPSQGSRGGWSLFKGIGDRVKKASAARTKHASDEQEAEEYMKKIKEQKEEQEKAAAAAIVEKESDEGSDVPTPVERFAEVQAEVIRLQKHAKELEEMISKRETEIKRVKRVLIHKYGVEHPGKKDITCTASEEHYDEDAVGEDELSDPSLDEDSDDFFEERTRKDIIECLNKSGTTCVQFPQANFIDEDLSYLNLSKSNFSASDMTHAKFFGTTMWSRWTSANLLRASARNSDFTHTNFDKATLQGGDFTAADFSYSSLLNTNAHTALMRHANFSHCKLVEINLSNADLRGATLRNVDLSKATLNNAQCDGADFQDANLSSADLASASLINCNLQGANLTAAVLVDRVGRRADFTGANLTGANLTGIVVMHDKKEGTAKQMQTLFADAKIDRILGFTNPGRLMGWGADRDPQ